MMRYDQMLPTLNTQSAATRVHDPTEIRKIHQIHPFLAPSFYVTQVYQLISLHQVHISGEKAHAANPSSKIAK